MPDEASESLLYWDADRRPQRLPPSAIVDKWPIDCDACGIPPLQFRDRVYRNAYRLIQAEVASGVILDASGRPGLKEVLWILVYEGPLGILGRKTVQDYGLVILPRWAEDLLNLCGHSLPDELKQYGVPARIGASVRAGDQSEQAAPPSVEVVAVNKPPLDVPRQDKTVPIDEVSQAPPAPAQEEEKTTSEPMANELNDTDRKFLRVLARQEAFSKEHKTTIRAVAEDRDERIGNVDSKHVTNCVAKLKSLGLIDTGRGPNGGVWLTPQGKKSISS